MSADNWTFCPKCKEKAEKAFAVKVKAVEDLYGKVSAGEFIKARETVREKPKLEETFREDYTIGVFENLFVISYSGSCTKGRTPLEKGCGFKVNYSYEKKVYPETCE